VPPNFPNASAISGFRLQRHHLQDGGAADLVTACRDVCGMQAQVMSAACLQLWARNHSITRSQVEEALWKTRRLVKTSLMRHTLHLIPADEFWLYIHALRSRRVAAALRMMARFGIKREEVEALTGVITNALASGPLGRAELTAAMRPKASKRVRAWMDKVWGIVWMWVPTAEGLICYGPSKGAEARFIRTDQWLPQDKFKPMTETEAQCALLQKYLRAYGPATLHDFAHWSGIPVTSVRLLGAHLKQELAEIKIENQNCLLLPDDLELLKNHLPEPRSARLLPHFDPYLLAHREKDHLLAAKHYKRVYRNQGWISPVVLIDGSVAGTWSHKVQGSKLEIKIEPFTRLSAHARGAIKQEAASLADFYGCKMELTIT
jgi:uncharacterized protein YcaQ